MSQTSVKIIELALPIDHAGRRYNKIAPRPTSLALLEQFANVDRDDLFEMIASLFDAPVEVLRRLRSDDLERVLDAHIARMQEISALPPNFVRAMKIFGTK
jgi:hypothetical protein